jgi:GNAT superfamily N-acetyltransferase
MEFIRDVEPGDARGIARIHAAAWKATYRGIIPDSVLDPMSEDAGAPRFLKGINAYLLEKPAQPFLVCVCGGNIAGFADTVKPTNAPEEFDSEIKAIYVDPGRQRKGIGTALVCETVRRLIQSNHRAMIIWAAAENPWRKFYEKIGGELLTVTKQIEIGSKPIPHVAYGWRDLKQLLSLIS